MLAYAGDLNGKLKDMTPEEFEHATHFFVDTEIVPAMAALQEALNAPARPWHKRAIEGIKFLTSIGSALIMSGEAAAVTAAMSSGAAQLWTELQTAGDKREAQKQSGLTYLLRLTSYQQDRP